MSSTYTQVNTVTQLRQAHISLMSLQDPNAIP